MLWKLMHLPLLLAVAMSPRPHADGRLPVKLHPSDRVIHRLLTVQEVSTLCHGHYGSRYRVTVRGCYQALRDQKLATLPGVQRLTSTIVMKRIVDVRPLPVSA